MEIREMKVLRHVGVGVPPMEGLLWLEIVKTKIKTHTRGGEWVTHLGQDLFLNILGGKIRSRNTPETSADPSISSHLALGPGCPIWAKLVRLIEPSPGPQSPSTTVAFSTQPRPVWSHTATKGQTSDKKLRLLPQIQTGMRKKDLRD